MVQPRSSYSTSRLCRLRGGGRGGGPTFRSNSGRRGRADGVLRALYGEPDRRRSDPSDVRSVSVSRGERSARIQVKGGDEHEEESVDRGQHVYWIRGSDGGWRLLVGACAAAKPQSLCGAAVTRTGERGDAGTNRAAGSRKCGTSWARASTAAMTPTEQLMYKELNDMNAMCRILWQFDTDLVAVMQMQLRMASLSPVNLQVRARAGRAPEPVGLRERAGGCTARQAVLDHRDDAVTPIQLLGRRRLSRIRSRLARVARRPTVWVGSRSAQMLGAPEESRSCLPLILVAGTPVVVVALDDLAPRVLVLREPIDLVLVLRVRDRHRLGLDLLGAGVALGLPAGGGGARRWPLALDRGCGRLRRAGAGRLLPGAASAERAAGLAVRAAFTVRPRVVDLRVIPSPPLQSRYPL